MSLYLSHIYLNLVLWKCGSVEVWKCGSVEIWKYANDRSLNGVCKSVLMRSKPYI